MVGAKDLILGIMDELLMVARAQECTFPANFKESTIEEMIKPAEANSIMYQDFVARRPMEVETYLASPKKLAQSVGLSVPRIETLYTIMHHFNVVNQTKPKDGAAVPATNGAPPPMPRMSSAPPPRPSMNGINGMNGMNGNGAGRGRTRTSSVGGPAPGMPGMRRGPPMNGGPNGFGRPPMNGYGPPRGAQSRRGSFDNELGDEFAHLALYDDIPENGSVYGGDNNDFALRERELMLRQRELAIREQEMRMRGGPRPRRGGGPAPSIRNGGYDDDDEDGEDFFDPMAGPPTPMIDPDNFDMMSVTSKRHRKAPINQRDVRHNPEYNQMPPRGGRGYRPAMGRNRSSANIIAQMPMDHASISADPLMSVADNRYGNVDRTTIEESRTSSLTAARLEAMQNGGMMPGGPGPFPRRVSQSPGNPYSPAMARQNGRPSPPNGPNGYMGRPPTGGRRSPPDAMRQPVPRYPPGQGNAVAPQQVEQHAGVSALLPPKGPPNVRSLTGSASASAGSGESATIDSENSAHSSRSSLGPRAHIGM